MSRHLKTLLAAFIPILAIALIVRTTGPKNPVIVPFLNIGVEHAQTGTLAITVTKNGNLRMVKIENQSPEALHISIPEKWKRTEVKGIALQNLKMESPNFSFVRFALPSSATITFTTSIPFAHLRIQNPSGKLLNVRYTDINLDLNKSSHDVFLVKDGFVELP